MTDPGLAAFPLIGPNTPAAGVSALELDLELVALGLGSRPVVGGR